MAKKKRRTNNPLDVFNASRLLKNLPFIVFLSFLALVYIANAHYSERTVREIKQLQTEIKELRWHYVSLQAQNMYESKRSEMKERVQPIGLTDKGKRPKRVRKVEK